MSVRFRIENKDFLQSPVPAVVANPEAERMARLKANAEKHREHAKQVEEYLEVARPRERDIVFARVTANARWSQEERDSGFALGEELANLREEE
jgi:hypothetical protein